MSGQDTAAAGHHQAPPSSGPEPMQGQEARQDHSKEIIAASRFSQQLIEQKERELQESIAINYTRIRDVERELRGLQMQVKLTAEPKKAALELLRTKIEAQNSRVQAVRRRYDVAKQAYEQLQAELDHEEGLKQTLCDELNQLVSNSVTSQLESFEQLKTKLEALQGTGAAGPGMGRASSAPAAAAAAAGASGTDAQHQAGDCANGRSITAAAQQAAPHQQQQQQRHKQQQEGSSQQLPVSTSVGTDDRQEAAEAAVVAAAAAAKAAEAAAEAEAARARHVQLPGRSRHKSGGGGAAGAAGRHPGGVSEQRVHATAQGADGRFAGFES